MSSNQNIDVSGEGNIIRVFSGGSLRIGNQSVDVSGEDNSVIIASSGSLYIGGQAPPKVRRGQVWQHNEEQTQKPSQLSLSEAIRSGSLDLQSKRLRPTFQTYPFSRTSIRHPFRGEKRVLADWLRRLPREGWTKEQIADWVAILELQEQFKAELRASEEARGVYHGA